METFPKIYFWQGTIDPACEDWPLAVGGEEAAVWPSALQWIITIKVERPEIRDREAAVMRFKWISQEKYSSKCWPPALDPFV